MRIWWGVVVVAVLCGSARAELEGQVDRLVEWQDSPLDLLRADQSELEMLPGVDADLASAILGLRELGELKSVEDLSRVPGMDEGRLGAIRPYVRAGSRSSTFDLHWSSVAQARDGVSPRVVHRIAVEGPGTRAWGLWVDDRSGWGRGGASAIAGRVEIFAGHLRVDVPGGLLATATSRSRLARSPLPRSPRTIPRTDASAEPGWTGGAVVFPHGLLFGGSDGAGGMAGAAAATLRARSLDVHAALRAGGGGWGAAIDVVRDRSAWIGLTAEQGVRSARSSIRLAGQQWRAGLDASTTDGALRAGSDPVSGHRLDRAHHCVQLHARLRSTAWSGGGIWRELVRGGERPVGTVEFDVAWNGRGPVGSVVGRLRAIPERRVSIHARRVEGRREWGFRFARQSTGSSVSELIAVEMRQSAGAHELRLALVGVDGNASRVWMVSRPQTGIYPVWIGPGGGLAATGWGLRAAGMRVGAWFWLRVGPDGSSRPGLGLFCSLDAVRVV